MVGSPSYRPPDASTPDGVGGLAAAIATAAVRAGGAVQLVGRIGDDAAGDALVVALGRAGIGHAAILRDAGHPTPILVPSSFDETADLGEPDVTLGGPGSPIDEGRPEGRVLPDDPADRPRLQAADLQLALRYLTDYSVVVADELDDAAAEAVSAGATFAGAQIVVIVPQGGRPSGALAGATVLEAPASDPSGAFARLVGEYAAALDAGMPPGDAFRSVVDRAGWEAVEA